MQWFIVAMVMVAIAGFPQFGTGQQNDSPGGVTKGTARSSTPIPWSELGSKAGAQYKGDGLSLSAVAGGARLRCDFQRLDGEVTKDGLLLRSTSDGQSQSGFRMKAVRLGRDGQTMAALDEAGTVYVEAGKARYDRPGLVEEYAVSVDGVRQDFVVSQRPNGVGPLRVELALSGGRAEPMADGARLVVGGMGRTLVYNRLHAFDAQQHQLTAHIAVERPEALTIIVTDTEAIYPIRIDPTFSDDKWSNVGLGMDDCVRALTIDNEGNLYAGGDFTLAGGIVANHVAKWNGSNWTNLGSGVDGQVFALAVDCAGNLYVGGAFTNAGGRAASLVAKWDGSAWSNLGTGLRNGVVPKVRALALDGMGNVYAGGYFYTAGDVTANCIAKWDGNVWTNLGLGVQYSPQFVSALAVDSVGNLYAGGLFWDMGGVAVNHVAKWDGNSWSRLGEGLENWPVDALALDGMGNLYAASLGVRQWNGSVWTNMYGVATGEPRGRVYSIAVDGSGNVYIGGADTLLFSTTPEYVAKWDGREWSDFDSGVNNQVLALTVDGSENLCVGGSFTTAGEKDAAHIAFASVPYEQMLSVFPLGITNAVPSSGQMTQTLWVANQGGGKMRYTNNADAAWLTVSPVTGVTTGATDVISVLMDAMGLPEGTYTGRVTISANVKNNPQQVTVIMKVGNPTLPNALDNDDLTWTTGGAAEWFCQPDVTYDGVDAAQSGSITDEQQTWMQTEVVGSGTISFWWKVDSEQGYDYLTFYVDGVVQSGPITGLVDWETYSTVVTGTGPHTLLWEYSKDVSVSSGADAGWVDQVVWQPAYTVPSLWLTPSSMLAMVSLNGVGTQTLWVANEGTGTLIYTNSTDAAWLSVSPPTGTSGWESDAISVVMDASGLAEGTYTGHVTVAANGTNSPQQVTVTLRVGDTAVTVSPASLPWMSNAWVNVAVRNLMPGAAIDLRLYVDADHDGVVSPVDRFLASFRVQDGVTNALGALTIVDDTDGVADGTISSRVAYFHQEGWESPMHVIGKYLWVASPIDGGATAAAGFEVTQPISPVWITGSVVDYVTSNAIPSAAVELATYIDEGNCAAWTDEHGAFRLYLPAGISTADVFGVQSAAAGYSSYYGEPEGFGECFYTNDLHEGENPLPKVLRLEPVFSNLFFSVTGHVYDDQAHALPGVVVWSYWGDDPESMAISDTNGAYQLTMPAVTDQDVIVFADAGSLMYLGCFATRQSVTVTGDVADIDLCCPQATVLVRGTVLAADNQDPIPGVPVYFNIDSDDSDLGETLRGEGVSLPDGTFEVGLIPYPNYSAKLEDNGRMGFLFPGPQDGFYIDSDNVPDVQFRLERGYFVRGAVCDTRTNGLPEASVQAYRVPEYDFWADADANRHGTYRILAPTGHLAVVGSCGNYYDQEYAFDPVENTTSGLTGIDLYLVRMVCWLETRAEGSGFVDWTSQWLPGGFEATLTAVADPYWHFSHWTGDTAGCTLADNQVTAVMDTDRSIVAVFDPDVAAYDTPLWWLAQYNLTNFDTDVTDDPDSDGMPTWQERVAGTDPTNGHSALSILDQEIDQLQGVTIRWPSSPNRFYDVMRSTNLLGGTSAFAILPGASNLPATPPENSYTDAVQVVRTLFYKVNVHE